MAGSSLKRLHFWVTTQLVQWMWSWEQIGRQWVVTRLVFSQIVLHRGKATGPQVWCPGRLCRSARGNNDTRGECREVRSSIMEVCVSFFFLGAGLSLYTWTRHPCVPAFQESSWKHFCFRKAESLLGGLRSNRTPRPPLQTSFIRDFLGFKNLVAANPFNSLSKTSQLPNHV